MLVALLTLDVVVRSQLRKARKTSERGCLSQIMVGMMLVTLLTAAGIRRDVLTRLLKFEGSHGTGESTTSAAISMMWSW